VASAPRCLHADLGRPANGGGYWRPSGEAGAHGARAMKGLCAPRSALSRTIRCRRINSF